MPPRPTPRQRAVLEAMSDGAALRNHGYGWFLDNGWGGVNGTLVNAFVKRGWIQHASHSVYVITEAGRRAVARSDGGV